MEKPLFFDYLIVGGGVAGVTAAETIRSIDGHGTILIISREDHPLYSRVLLPNYVRQKITREKLFLRTWEQYQKLRIDVATRAEVIGVNFDTREVVTNREEKIAFGKLLISTGGTPRGWRVNGSELPNVFRLQTIEDADKIRESISALAASADPRALIIGGGFIGLEFMETAVHFGFETHLFLKDKQMFGEDLDEQGWHILSDNFKRNHVIIHESTEIKYLSESPEQPLVGHTSTSEEISGAWLGIGIGLERNVTPFAVAGLDIRRGVRTNQFLETSLSRVWAAGDVAEYFDVLLDEYRIVSNWTNAFLQGRVAGANMAAQHDKKTELRAVSSYSINSFGHQLTFVGKTSPTDGVESIVRTWPDNPSAYERLFLKAGRLQGAVLMNRFQDKAVISSLISSKKEFVSAKDSLQDPYVDISSLV
ncbi:MAG: FAD-dependent oxidoreductase [Patescibacteria group bacterium]